MTKLETIQNLESQYNVLICRTFDDNGEEVYDVYDNAEKFWVTVRSYRTLSMVLKRGMLGEVRRDYERWVKNDYNGWFGAYMFAPSKLNLWNEEEKEKESWTAEMMRTRQSLAS